MSTLRPVGTGETTIQKGSAPFVQQDGPGSVNDNIYSSGDTVLLRGDLGFEFNMPGSRKLILLQPDNPLITNASNRNHLPI
jgi:hypothetical protein